MRSLAAAFALFALAAPVSAGPIDSLQYNATLGVIGLYGPGVSGPGPMTYGNDAAYPLGQSPLFGVLAGGSSGATYPAYPSADFAFISIGHMHPYIAGGVPATNVSGHGEYYLDFEFRDAAGHTGVLSFQGTLEVGWSGGWGYSFPSSGQSGSVVLGDTRYDMRLSSETSFVLYEGTPGAYIARRIPLISTPYQDGDYTRQGGVVLYATITAAPEPPVATPEPGTLALAAIGLGGLFATRRTRRAA